MFCSLCALNSLPRLLPPAAGKVLLTESVRGNLEWAVGPLGKNVVQAVCHCLGTLACHEIRAGDLPVLLAAAKR